MSLGSPTYNPRSFVDGLKPFRRRVLGIESSLLCLVFAASIILCLLLLLWIDTVWALPTEFRWGATRGGILIAIASLIASIGWRFRKLTNDGIADRIDRSINSGGEILAGWQLATRPVKPANAFSQGLADIAAKRAAEKVRYVPTSIVATVDALKKPAMLLFASIVMVTTIAAIAPGIAWHQAQRFLYPAKDIPPYTGIEIDLVLERDSVLYGQDAIVRANVLFGKVERMTLVIVTAGGAEQTLPMLAQSEVAWQSILSRVTEPLTVYARSGLSRSKKHSLDVQLTPQILPPTVTITSPEYTKTSPYRGKIPIQGLVGLAGTQVDWRVSSNRPLKNGTLTITYRSGDKEIIELKPIPQTANKVAGIDQENNFVVGILQLTKPGEFEIFVTDVEGVNSQDNISGTITISRDQRPIVRIIQPQPFSIATPDIVLPAIVLAEDDYGLSSLTLYRSLNGSPASPSKVTIESNARVQHRWELPLASFGLIPGDEIQLFARTEDNDPSGAKGAESPITTVQIISLQDFQKMILQQKGAESIQAKYQIARRHFDQLTSALRDVDEAAKALSADKSESKEAVENLQNKLNAAKEKAAQAANELAKLANSAMPIDVDQELAKALGEMSQEASEMAKRLEAMRQNAKPTLSEKDQQDLQKMIEKTKGSQKALTDNAIDPLEQMQKMMPLIIDEQRFAQIVEQQKDLAERLKGLQSADANDAATQRRVAELESEQEILKQQLNQLLDDIERHATELPDDPKLIKLRSTAQEFVDAVRASTAEAEMAEAQQGLLAEDFDRAQINAKKGADTLARFLKQCSGMGNKACENCEAAFKPGGTKMGNSIQQMLKMMGMKGQSGTKPGSTPGMGMGYGAGGGYAQRFAGPQNIGMYGSIPAEQISQSRGQGDRQSQGFQTSKAFDTSAGGASQNDLITKGESAGQSMNSIPATYRAKVSEYLRNLSDQIGNAEGNKEE